MKSVSDKKMNNEIVTDEALKHKKSKFNIHQRELDELKEHVDLISFNISKVYRQARDRSRKEYNKIKYTTKNKGHYSHSEDENGFHI